MRKRAWDMVGMAGISLLLWGVARINVDFAIVVGGIAMLIASIIYALGDESRKMKGVRRDQ